MFNDSCDKGPLRTRGPLQTPGARPASGAIAPGAAVRARGAGDGPDGPRSPRDLIRRLRQDVGGQPIVVAVHDQASDGSAAFIRAVVAELHSDDALWLCPPVSTGPTHPPPLGIAVVALDFSRRTDQRAYDNLVADLVFFSGDSAGELDLLPKWHARLRTLVLHAGTPFNGRLAGDAVTLKVPVYDWVDDRLRRVV